MIKASTLLFISAALWSCAALASDQDDARVAVAQAQTAVQSASSADAARYASSTMQSANQNLAAAQGAMDRRNWKTSIMSAEDAQADANLASARARQTRATQATKEIEASLQTLRQQVAQPGSQP